MPTIQRPRRAATRRILPTVILCGFGFCGAIADDSPAGVRATAGKIITPASRDASNFLSVKSPPVVQQIDAATRRIEVGDTDSLLLQYPDWLTTVKSFDPKVIRVSAVRPDCLRIERLAGGTTTLQAVDRNDRVYSVEVIVRPLADGR